MLSGTSSKYPDQLAIELPIEPKSSVVHQLAAGAHRPYAQRRARECRTANRTEYE
jgi:hypothetical protein